MFLAAGPFFVDAGKVAVLATYIIAEVRRLVAADKLSYRKIGRLVGVSRNTVGAIASGRRPDYEAAAARRDGEHPEESEPLSRCPSCGGMVHLPCRLCGMRELMASSRLRPPRKILAEEPLRLQLKEEHQRRYEEVRARRQGEDLLHPTSPLQRLSAHGIMLGGG
jgi:hypothetical protein